MSSSTAKSTQLQIDPEFRALIPPLSAEERIQLEENLLRDGCRDPLVVWNVIPVDGEHKCYGDDPTRCELQAGDGVWTCLTCGYNPLPFETVLLDGHNRFEICQKHDIEYDVFEQGCESRDDAKIWIIRNQFGRRNLASFARGELALKLEPLIAAKAKTQQGQRTDLSPTLAKSERIDTRAEIAKAAGVSHGTIDKVRTISAKAPEPVKEQLRRGEISIDRAYQDIRGQERRQERVDNLVVISRGNVELATDVTYPVIYVDPPWRYEHVKTDNRAIENQYPTMDLDAICALPVSALATPDALLFLWATSPKLSEAMRVVDAWGFTYRTSMVWVKDQIGMGYYARQRHELLLIATKGQPPVPEPANRPDSVVTAPRTEHSAKPAAFYDVIERMYPELPKIELFCRAPRDGWAAWGNQS